MFGTSSELNPGHVDNCTKLSNWDKRAVSANVSCLFCIDGIFYTHFPTTVAGIFFEYVLDYVSGFTGCAQLQIMLRCCFHILRGLHF